MHIQTHVNIQAYTYTCIVHIQAYVQKIRLFAVEDEDDDLYQQALKCQTEQEARDMLESWCNENEVPVPFLQVIYV